MRSRFSHSFSYNRKMPYEIAISSETKEMQPSLWAGESFSSDLCMLHKIPSTLFDVPTSAGSAIPASDLPAHHGFTPPAETSTS